MTNDDIFIQKEQMKNDLLQRSVPNLLGTAETQWLSTPFLPSQSKSVLPKKYWYA